MEWSPRGHKKILAFDHTMLCKIGIREMKDRYGTTNIKERDAKSWIPQNVDFCMGIIDNDWRRSPISLECVNSMVKCLKNMMQVLFANAGYDKEGHKYVISPFIEYYDCVQRILKHRHELII